MSEEYEERMKRISETSGDLPLEDDDINWLIAQARRLSDAEPIIEKVAKLNEYISSHDVGVGRWGESVIDIAMDELKRYKEENDRLREGLNFYATCQRSDLHADGGNWARQTLEDTK